MSAERSREPINYWPGYVDALVNVLLNLLFLLGVFIVGLVMLNVQAIQTQRKLVQAQLRNIFDDADAAQRERKAKAALKALPAPQKLLPMPVPPSPTPPAQAGVEVAEANPSEERRPPSTQDIRIPKPLAAPRAQTAGGELPDPVEDTWVAKLAGGGRVLALFTFGVNQYQLPAEVALPQGLDPQTDQRWLLLALADPANPRLNREALARLMSVRAALGRAGIEPERIQVRIANPAPIDVSPSVERTVFVLAQPR